MGMVVVISLPFILFSILLGFGCYFLGRAKGRQDLRKNAQVYGVPAPPPGSDFGSNVPAGGIPTPTAPGAKYSSYPHQSLSKNSDNLSNIV